MAQFRAEIQGARGKASRLGTKQSGMWAHVRGWNVGVRVEVEHVNGRDRLVVYRTGGSNAPANGDIPLAIVEDEWPVRP